MLNCLLFRSFSVLIGVFTIAVWAADEKPSSAAIYVAGIAVVADAAMAPLAVESISIVPADLAPSQQVTGYVQYSAEHSQDPIRSETDLIATVASLIAGAEAEALRTGKHSTSRSRALAHSQIAIRRFVHKTNKFPELQAYLSASGQIIDSPPPSRLDNYLKYVGRIVQDATTFAKQEVMRNWHVMNATIELVQRFNVLRAAQFQEIIAAGWPQRAEMDELLRQGWTVEKADKIKIDLSTIKGCNRRLGVVANVQE